jgi:Family of unknown function (DUF6165)
MTISIEVSYGELVDKMTILEIKSIRLEEPTKLNNVQAELAAIKTSWSTVDTSRHEAEVRQTIEALKQVNLRLWDIEDAIRLKESAKSFDPEFIELARSVYIENDQRARLKKHLDGLLGSRFSEEKSYKPY